MEDAPQLQSFSVYLLTYMGEELNILGSINVTVEYQLQKKRLRVLVHIYMYCSSWFRP